VGLLLSGARQRAGWRQRDVAARLAINLTTYAKYEVGIHPVPLQRLRALALVLGAPELTAEAERLGTLTIDRLFIPGAITTDVFLACEAAFDWWSARVVILREQSALRPARIEALRRLMAARVRDLLQEDGVRLAQVPETMVVALLERELATLLDGYRDLDARVAPHRTA